MHHMHTLHTLQHFNITRQYILYVSSIGYANLELNYNMPHVVYAMFIRDYQTIPVPVPSQTKDKDRLKLWDSSLYIKALYTHHTSYIYIYMYMYIDDVRNITHCCRERYIHIYNNIVIIVHRRTSQKCRLCIFRTAWFVLCVHIRAWCYIVSWHLVWTIWTHQFAYVN